MNEVNLAVYWVKQGMRLISVGSEAGLMMKGGLAVTTALAEALGR
jgi:hypothetical protein